MLSSANEMTKRFNAFANNVFNSNIANFWPMPEIEGKKHFLYCDRRWNWTSKMFLQFREPAEKGM